MKSRSSLKIEYRVDLNSSRCMHDPSFMALALIVSEKMTEIQKVYAADDDDDDNDDNDDAGKAIHMSRFCFAGETKTLDLFS